MQSRAYRFIIRTLMLCAAACAIPALAASEVVHLGVHGNQIGAARLDTSTGRLTVIGPVANNARPTWMVRHPRLPILYATEDAPTADSPDSGIHSYRVDDRTGALTLLSDVRAGAKGTTHLWFDAPSATLLAANFSGSLATFSVSADGTPGPVTSLTRFVGSGPLRRQEGPHAHGVSVDPSGRWALVADLGADRLWVLPFDRATGKVGTYDPASPLHHVAAPGSGPRHMAWHPSGRFLFLVNELSAAVDVFGWDAESGRLTIVQSLATEPPGFSGQKSAAEILVSRDGRFLYVSSRSDHSIVSFRIDARSGTLTALQRIDSGGERPWHMDIDRSGRWMLVANRDSNRVSVLKRDRNSGRLAPTGHAITLITPVHVHLRP